MSGVGLRPGLDFSDPDLWASKAPIEELALLRRTAPVWWNAQSDEMAMPFNDGGFWVVTKNADVREVSTRPELYSSNANGAVVRFPGFATPEALEATKTLVLNMDPPKHTRLRRIISKGFTPRAVEALRGALSARAEDIVRQAKQSGGGDFVDQVARELPLQAIAELLGIPQEDRHRLFDWSNSMLNFDDDEYGDAATASAELLGYAWNMAQERQAHPTEDIISQLVNSDAGGEALSSDEFGFFVVALAVAGNETTRNATVHGMKAFVDNPAQWELYKEKRPRTAPDEIIRWATPIIAFQRTATQDTELGGQQIRAGQRVAMFYSSANFDESVFDDPFIFDVFRDPNPHVAFGGTGVHFCIGANLARLQLDLLFNAIADHMPNLRQIAEPERLRSGFINGIKHWQVSYD